jgi:hypothetical protein
VHILMFTVFGLVVLALFLFMARLIRSRGHAVDGASAFIWVWLLASVANGAVGVLQAGIPLMNEIAAFLVIFGIPAAVAWYLSRRTVVPAKS